MSGFNPIIDYQRNNLLAQQAMINNQLNQLNQMNNGQMYSPPPNQFTPYSPPQPQNNQPQFFVRPVGNIEEAKSFPIDPGIMYFFPDVAAGKIYFKQMNMKDGKSDFYTYAVQENVTAEVKTDPIEEIRGKLTNIENQIRALGALYDKSVSGITGSTAGNAASNAGNAGSNDVSVSESKPADVSANSRHGKR